MQIAAPLARPVRRFLPTGGLSTRPVLLVLLGLAVIAGASVVVYQRFLAPAPPVATAQIVPVQRGNVAATVSATGSVVATRQAKLVFASSGRIKDILVNVGDHVTACQALARLGSATHPGQLYSAKSHLTTARTKKQQINESATPQEMVTPL